MKHNKLLSALLVCAAGVASTAALAGYDVLNLPPGATATARANYSLHVFVLWICVGIFVVVFGAMFYSIIKHRKSVGHKAEHFHENATIEILWTAIPFVIIAVMTAKATGGLLTLRDTSKSDMTIKITAHQWQWKYDYSTAKCRRRANRSRPAPGKGRTTWLKWTKKWWCRPIRKSAY
jgi:cytochrome c oxidase subunit II